MANPLASLITLQNVLDKVLPLGDVHPILQNVAGYQLEPFASICTDVMTEIFAQPFPYKWTEVDLPVFYTNSFQQDYAITNPDGTSFYNCEWLTRGIVVQMTANTLPKPWGYVECGRQLTQATATFVQVGLWNNPTFTANLMLNKNMYFGTWGAGLTGTNSLGNDPGPGAIYTAPVGINNTNSQVSNPINQIRDSNGNLLVVTLLNGAPYNSAPTVGVCGSTPPTAPVGAAPGTQVQDGTVTWTVVDPLGLGVRVLPVPSSTGVVFQFNLVGQQPCPNFSNPPQAFISHPLDQTLSPLPDKYEPYFREGVIAQCYRYSTDAKVYAKFEKAHQLWLAKLINLREMQDRELEENRFTPERGIMGGNRRSWPGPFYPFNAPW